MIPVAIVIPSYNGCDSLRYELETMRMYDPTVFETPILIIEDPCDFPGVATEYDKIAEEYKTAGCWHLPVWRNMHGAARDAFQIAMDVYDPKWIIYIGDDLAITPGSISNMIYFVTENELKTVGLVQFPYWNAHDISENKHGDWQGPTVLGFKERDFYADMEWPLRVPRNPHWDGPGHSQPYINVNGAGFVCRASMYRDVGGFAEGTWCLDESIAHRMWLKSDYACVTLPGPPFVHYFGGSTVRDPPPHDMYTEGRWIEAMGMSKAESGQRIREKMDERWAKVEAEMKTCKYLYGKTD